MLSTTDALLDLVYRKGGAISRTVLWQTLSGRRKGEVPQAIAELKRTGYIVERRVASKGSRPKFELGLTGKGRRAMHWHYKLAGKEQMAQRAGT